MNPTVARNRRATIRAGSTPRRGVLATWVACGLLLLLPTVGSAQVIPRFLYTLSNFTGAIPYNFARLAVDPERDETYVVYGNDIRIFNATGMEIFRFGDNLALGRVADLAVDGNGDIVILSYDENRPVVTQCDYRGVPRGAIEIRGLPESTVFSPNRMVYRDGRLYFLTTTTARVTVTDASGQFQEAIDLFADVDLGEKNASGEAEVTGFSVDGEGNILFTVAVAFKAFRRTPDGKVTGFGRPGAAPGRFGIVAGIVSDSRGNILVADKLKSVVIAFDKRLNYITEFGRRGSRPENLIIPEDLVVDRRDRIYVTQAAKRGVSVFSLSAD
jgi:hypothetical protein